MDESTEDRGSVGFIGLGIMGRPMATNVLRAGYALTVHSRSPEPVDALVEAGAARASSPREVAEISSVVITMLPDTPDVEQVLFGTDGIGEGAQRGSIVIDMSTSDPLSTRAFASRLDDMGVAMLDAPVSGGEKGALAASLSIMVGGPEASFLRALPILKTMGKTIVRTGEAGAGQVAKACNQLVVAVTIQAVAEALVLAVKAGVDPALVREALLGGFASSPILEAHGNWMLTGDFTPGFRARLHLKDARIIQNLARELHADVRAANVATASLERLVDAGRGELDHSALVTVIEEASGASLRPVA